MSRPLKILQITDKFSMDGVNPSSLTMLFGDWIPAFAPTEFQHAVCTLRRPDPAGAHLEKRGIRVHYVGNGKLSPRNIGSILELIEREQADVVHLHGYASANFGRIASRRAGVLNVVHEHAILKVLPHQYVADRVLRGMTDSGIAVSHKVRDFMVDGRSIPEERIRVIGNCVDLERFSPLDEATIHKQRAALKLDERTQAIGVVTRFREEKGNEYLIRAMPPILERCPDAILLIAGDGPLRAQLERLASELGLGQKVRFLGFVSDPVGLLSCCDVTAIPSLTEGFPLTLIEAMALGQAIVATDVGGMPEIGVDDETVLFVPPRDPAALAERVVQLLKNRALAQRLGATAFGVRGRFGVPQHVEKLAELYLDLVRGRGPVGLAAPGA